MEIHTPDGAGGLPDKHTQTSANAHTHTHKQTVNSARAPTHSRTEFISPDLVEKHEKSFERVPVDIW